MGVFVSRTADRKARSVLKDMTEDRAENSLRTPLFRVETANLTSKHLLVIYLGNT